MPDHDVRGKSLLDLLWEQLDQFVDDLQLVADVIEDSTTLWEAKGRAHAAAMCVALATNPYSPQVDAIKAEAMERWVQREEPATPVTRPQRERTTSMTNEERRRRREQRAARRAARNG